VLYESKFWPFRAPLGLELSASFKYEKTETQCPSIV